MDRKRLVAVAGLCALVLTVGVLARRRAARVVALEAEQLRDAVASPVVAPAAALPARPSRIALWASPKARMAEAEAQLLSGRLKRVSRAMGEKASSLELETR